ncbi:MAG: hypothetical protein KGK08_13610, partial [Acidobacteriota bacterium]|nr:hypothetical protein [Acidobacteriota bacterium]
VGRKALKYWNSLQIDSLPSVPEKNGTEVHSIAGRNRIVVYLAHPSGPEPKLFSYWVSPAAMDRIRIVLSENA